MTFPTVKSNPWAKGAKRRRSGPFRLWSEQFWRGLCELDIASSVFFSAMTRGAKAIESLRCVPKKWRGRDLSAEQLDAIREQNRRLYGDAA